MEMEYVLLVALVSAVAGAKIRVTTIEEVPYVDVQGMTYTGFIPELLKLIAKKENIEYEFQTVQDGRYGALSNGRWNGMVGEIKYKDADLAAAPITISDQRKQAVDFSPPFMSFGTTIIIKKPEDGENNPINSAQDLVDQDEIGYGIVRDGETQRFFKSSQEQPYKRMWQYMEANQDMLVNNVEDGVRKVRDSNGKYAFIIESSTADYWINKRPCDLVKVGDNFNSKSYGFAFRKEDPLKQKLDRAIKSLKSEGKLKELKDKYWKSDAQCSGGATVTVLTTLTWVVSLVTVGLLSR